ncbi:VCBS repeat-containing protein [Algibacter agarivorans]|uniref:VCBS repeat-containing protein n=1 Tax=Algibacter agarivorans TaxID=1109741 RepID=A0ABP9GVW4_9FLAO
MIGGFELLSPEKTSIDFNNTIQETATKNHLYYSQIYNGAGVAIGDINNDGLDDIFFCGNQVADRLYLNKGNFQFENITKSSKVSRKDGWSWGVTMADVNADGYLDIYVSRNGESMNPNERQNQLLINNGDLTFTESANKYGLADLGFSSQAVFFDMDNDGDLDMYQVNQPPDPRLFNRYKIPKERQLLHTDKLYRNDNGYFRDVSKTSGISETLAHGLSVSASDFNNDGWTDLYVSNDYDEPDFMYYNNGNGTFKIVSNETLKHISWFSMGTDAADINNDGLIDLMTLDMAAEDHYRSKTNMGSMSTERFNQMVSWGKHYQYMVNTLQVNSGMGTFYDVGGLTGISKTDWSWAPLVVDLDNDGWKDIIVTNGIKKDIRNNDFLSNTRKELNSGSKDFLSMAKKAPSAPLSNYVFKNKGQLKFEKTSKDWGFDTPSYSSGIAYGDLDNDGDLDIIINNIDAPAFVYKNNATGNYLKVAFKGSEKNPLGIGAKVIIYHNNKKQIAEHSLTRGYFSSVAPGVFFGLGKDTQVDSLKIIWQGGKFQQLKNIEANTTAVLKYSKAKNNSEKQHKKDSYFKEINTIETGITYQHQENDFDDFEREILLPHKLSQNGPFSAVADVNNDGLEDVFFGGAIGQSGSLYIQQPSGSFKENSSQPWGLDATSEDLGCLFLDVDTDGDKDLYVASGGSEFNQGDKQLQDRLYLNNGQGVFTKSQNKLPKIYESTQCVKAADIDNDGDLDVFVGTRLIAGKYPYPATSYILINDNDTYKKAGGNIAPDLQDIGMVTDATFSDVDTDGDLDLLLVGEWMNITFLENEKGIFKNNSKKWGLNDTRGIWWSITASDLDNDGDDDYIIGNLGNNNKFKATKEHPFKVYANDFDKNGTNDVVLAKFYKEDYVPVRGRECTSQQMHYVSEKFKDYHSFASSKLVEILPEDEVEKAVVYEISDFKSIVLINDNGKFIKKPLPVEAQTAPLKSALVLDINSDGNKDIISVGNHYGAEVETTRYDAGIGTVLLGDGKHDFTAISPLESGFYVPHDSRQINTLKTKDKYVLMVTNNNSTPTFFNKNNN